MTLQAQVGLRLGALDLDIDVSVEGGIAIALVGPNGAGKTNMWAGRVLAVEPLGERVRVRLAGPPGIIAELTGAAAAELALVENVGVWVSIKATDVAVYYD